MTEHSIGRRVLGGRHRWECACGEWRTEWTFYTRPQDAPAALRHALGIRPADRLDPALERIREWRERKGLDILISRELPESDPNDGSN